MGSAVEALPTRGCLFPVSPRGREGAADAARALPRQCPGPSPRRKDSPTPSPTPFQRMLTVWVVTGPRWPPRYTPHSPAALPWRVASGNSLTCDLRR